jgi:hypothetical protein
MISWVLSVATHRHGRYGVTCIFTKGPRSNKIKKLNRSAFAGRGAVPVITSLVAEAKRFRMMFLSLAPKGLTDFACSYFAAEKGRVRAYANLRIPV